MNETTSRRLPQDRLIEGRDYTQRPDGALVFSREYHLARGSCCGSKCLHCPYVNSRDVMDRSKMRPIVSMVPSWTETLIAAGLNVVARTRFCVHPEDSVRAIPILGGTKTLAPDAMQTFERILNTSSALRPLVVLDREENPKDYFDFFARYDCEILVSHVIDFASLAGDLQRIAAVFSHASSGDADAAQRLVSYANRTIALDIVNGTLGRALIAGRESLDSLDCALASGTRDTYYFIWRNPWMVVAAETWIGHALRALFPKIRLPQKQDSKYPIVEPSEIPSGSNLLFSSEPFPFFREWDELLRQPFVKSAETAAIVDGENFSWFGIRAIRFLEEAGF